MSFSKYRVLSLLGEGGMGIVYLAEDSVLRRKVALKFLPDALQQDEPARQRFLNEARIAAALDHPYVCKIYETGEFEGRVYIAMEYVEGETVREVLRRGPMQLSEALDKGMEIAEALETAHSRGIIHRDLKPANIMSTRSGHLKVMDFGLAKSVQTDETENRSTTASIIPTAPGRIVGTMAYMSPEQLRSQHLDVRSDIFALGVVLFEMVTGRHPFSRPTAADTVSAILHEQAPPLKRFVKQNAAILQDTLVRLLAKDPAKRSSSAREVLTNLQHVRRELAQRERNSHKRFNKGLAAVLLLALALGAWLLVRFIVTLRQPLVAAGAEVLLADVDNRTGDTQLDALKLVLANQLSQSSRIHLPEEGRIREVLQQMERRDQRLDADTTREIAWRAGIALVVLTRVYQVGSKYALGLQIEKTGKQPPKPEARWSTEYRADNKEGLLDAVDHASRWIREITGEAERDRTERDLPAREATTSSWEALDLFSRADKLVFQEKDDDAVRLLKQALELDPKFALAHLRLADRLFILAREREGFDHYQDAIRLLDQNRLTKHEELRIKAQYAHDSGDYVHAEEGFRTYALYYPNEPAAFFSLGLALEESGREEEAIQQFLKAKTLASDRFYLEAHLGMDYLRLGNYAEAANCSKRLRELKSPYWADTIDGSSWFLQGAYAKAEEQYRSLIQSGDPEWQSRGRELMSFFLGETGRYREALDVLKAGIQLDSKNGLPGLQAGKLLSAAYIHYRCDEREAVKSLCLEAFRLDTSPGHLAAAATLLARAGFPDDAQNVAKGLLPVYGVPLFLRAQHRVAGEILLARGNPEQALREFKEAGALDPPAACREYLARALDRSAERAQALRAYKEIVDSQARVWQDPAQVFPGIWADALFEYIRLAWEANRRDEVRQTVDRYLALRAHADTDVHDLASVRRMADLLNHARRFP